MKVINRLKIYKLHQKYAHGKYADKLLEIGWNHSLIVADIASQIVDSLKKNYKIVANRKLVVLGALVHDIGFYVCFEDNLKPNKDYLTHGYLGYKIAIKEGLGEQLARFCSCHTTTGISREDVIQQKIPLEAKDYIPITLEEEIVCYADIFHSKGHPKFNSYEDQLRDFPKFSQSYVEVLKRFMKKFGLPDLSKMEIKYKKWHKEINNWIDQTRKQND